MGSWSITCGVSKFSIKEDDKIMILPLLSASYYGPTRTKRNDYCVNEYKGDMIFNPTSGFLYSTDMCIPLCFPIECTYADYGRITDIKKDINTKSIEEFIGLSIEDFIYLIMGNNDDRTFFHTNNRFYEKFFLYKKEMKDSNISIKDFLLLLGFTNTEDNKYSLENAKYHLVLINDNEFSVNDEKRTYTDKIDVLNVHYSETNEYLGVENQNIIKLLSNVSAMVIHLGVYEYMSTKIMEDIFGSKAISQDVHDSILKKWGFELTKDGWVKNSILLTEDYYGHITIKTDDKTITVSNSYPETKYESFISAWKDLTNEILSIDEIIDKDRLDMLYDELLVEIEKQELKYRDWDLELNRQEHLLMLINDCFVFDRYFKKMKFFTKIYKDSLFNEDLKPMFTKYLHFMHNCDYTNILLFPTCNGMPDGWVKPQRELAQFCLNFIDNKIKTRYEDEEEWLEEDDN